MRKGTRALLAAGVAAGLLASATTAQAVNVDGSADAYGTRMIWISTPAVGEHNEITVKAYGSVQNKDGAWDPAFPNAPLSLVVTDSATPLGDATNGCIKLSAHTARCTALDGYDWVEAALSDDSGAVKDFTFDPGRQGATTPMWFEVTTGLGDDHVSIPVSRGLSIYTQDGNDTITANDISTQTQGAVNSGTGDDQVQLTASGSARVDCGDGVDTASVFAPTVTTMNCETVTPGPHAGAA
jgi:hypothetical protein